MSRSLLERHEELSWRIIEATTWQQRNRNGVTPLPLLVFSASQAQHLPSSSLLAELSCRRHYHIRRRSRCCRCRCHRIHCISGPTAPFLSECAQSLIFSSLLLLSCLGFTLLRRQFNPCRRTEDRRVVSFRHWWFSEAPGVRVEEEECFGIEEHRCLRFRYLILILEYRIEIACLISFYIWSNSFLIVGICWILKLDYQNWANVEKC